LSRRERSKVIAAGADATGCEQEANGRRGVEGSSVREKGRSKGRERRTKGRRQGRRLVAGEEGDEQEERRREEALDHGISVSERLRSEMYASIREEGRTMPAMPATKIRMKSM
jgi:hypothetical protein